jgi:hypothetical protein
MRPSTLAFACLAPLAVAAVAVFALSGPSTAAHQPRLDANRALVARLALTDLALFTEARYTRHPSQADLHSALQDHPGAFDHFPSGSLLAPPALIRRHASLDRKAASPD